MYGTRPDGLPWSGLSATIASRTGLASALDDVLRGAVDGGAVPAVVGLVTDRWQVVYHEAFGWLDAGRRMPLPRDAIFRLHSMTKPLTSVALMMLCSEGRVRLDDPVSAYLPEWAEPRVLVRASEDGRCETRPARARLTVRHLLAHTSGIGYAFSSPDLLRLVRATGKSELELPLLHDPGERWTYGCGTKLVGDIVAAVSGMPLDAFLAERLLGPLGMEDTSYRVPEDRRCRVVTRHSRRGDALIEEPNDPVEAFAVRGDLGLYGTAADYAAFMRLILNEGVAGGRRVAGAEALRAMGEDQIHPLRVELQPAADPERARPFPLGAGRDGFGFGFQIARHTGTAERSPGSLSWSGLRNTHFWIDRARGLGVVLMMQLLPFYDAAAIDLVLAFERRLYEQVA